MGDLGWRTVIALLAAIITGTVSAAAAASYEKSRAEVRIEALARESERQRMDLEAATREVSRVRPALEQLRREHAVLEERYLRCTSSVGKTVVAHPISSAWATTELHAGDRLDFGMVDSRISLVVVRITTDGPVLRVEGCRYPGSLEAIESPPDGVNAFVLTRARPLVLRVSRNCCERGLAVCDLSDLEEIRVELLDIDVDQQIVSVRYAKRLV